MTGTHFVMTSHSERAKNKKELLFFCSKNNFLENWLIPQAF